MTEKEAIEKATAVLCEATGYDESVCYITREDEEWILMAIKALNICHAMSKGIPYIPHNGKIYKLTDEKAE